VLNRYIIYAVTAFIVIEDCGISVGRAIIHCADLLDAFRKCCDRPTLSSSAQDRSFGAVWCYVRGTQAMDLVAN